MFVPEVIQLVSAVEAAFNELSKRSTNTDTIVVDDEEHDCYSLSLFPDLHNIVSPRFSSASYVSVEDQKDPDTNEPVFSLLFFDDDEELLGGLCLTRRQIYWDDE